MKYVCEKACFFRNHLWKEGEYIDVKDGENTPRFFALSGSENKRKVKIKANEPTTFREVQIAEAEAQKKSVLDILN